jgi:hypothetical protein
MVYCLKRRPPATKQKATPDLKNQELLLHLYLSTCLRVYSSNLIIRRVVDQAAFTCEAVTIFKDLYANHTEENAQS